MREKSTILVLLWLQKNEKQISIGEIYYLSRCIITNTTLSGIKLERVMMFLAYLFPCNFLIFLIACRRIFRIGHL